MSVDARRLPIALLVFVDGGLTQVNQDWTALTGMSEAESLDDGWLAAVHPDDRVVIASIARADVPFAGGQVRLRNERTETEVWVQTQLRSIGSPVDGVAVVTMTGIGTPRSLESDLQHRARHDPMTGLLDRAAFLDEIDDSLAERKEDVREAAVFYLDLDGFKSVNDQNGHAVGDQLLILAAERLQATTRSGDLVGRMGDDEFAVFHSTVRAEGAGRIAERFATVLSYPYAIGGQPIRITASVGVATFAGDPGASAIVDRATRAMYRAKAAPEVSWVDDDAERR